MALTAFACAGMLLTVPLSGQGDASQARQAQRYSLPLPVVRVLGNGLSCAFIERRTVPLVTVEVVVQAGAEADPPGAPGTASLVARLLPQGTTTQTAGQIAESVDQAGADLETGADWDRSTSSMTVLSNHADLAFDVLADIVEHPAFPASQLQQIRQRILSALEVERADPAYLADEALRVRLFAGTPYGHPLDGTRASLRRITPQALEAFHAEYYRPSNAFVLILGDLSENQAFGLATRYFGGWKPMPPPAQIPPSKPLGGKSRAITVIDDPAAVQTAIRIGNLAVSRAAPQFEALVIANQVLGGPAVNRLYNALRTRRGLVYGASSRLECYRTLGAWMASASTRTADTAEALRIMLSQIQNMSRGDVLPSEDGMAEDYLIGHQALQFESFPGMASSFLPLMVYDLPLDAWNLFPYRIRSLSLDQVDQVARQYIRPEGEVVVLAGDAAKFAGQLKRFGTVRVIPLSRLDFSSSRLEGPAAPN